jgi:hypothetical protein
LRRRHAVPGTHSINEQQRCDLGDSGFHRCQPNELTVQLRHHFVDTGLLAGIGEIDDRVRGKWRWRCLGGLGRELWAGLGSWRVSEGLARGFARWV